MVDAMRIVPSLLAALAVAAPAAGATIAAAPRYTNAQLALMVLPRSQLGAVARGLDVKLGSGVQGNAAAAKDTLDPKDTAGGLARGGRIGGYSLEYDDLSFQGLESGRGVLAVGSSVDVFTSAGAADRYAVKQLADGKRYDGKYVEAGFRLADWRTSRVKGLGPGATLVRETLRLGVTRYHGTLVFFRVGTLLGSVGITRADAAPETRRTVALARKLARRMRHPGGPFAVAPAFVPQTAQQGKAPAGGPRLERMTPTAGDLPSGGQLVRDSYVASRSALGKYVREYRFQGARLGGAGLFSVETELNLLRSQREARGVMRRLRALYGSPDVERAFTDGFNVQSVEVEQARRTLRAGDDAVAVVLSFRVNGRLAHVAQVSMRVGRVVGLLNVGVVGPSFRAAAIEPLAAKLGQRIRSGL